MLLNNQLSKLLNLIIVILLFLIFSISEARTIDFAGREWVVKTGYGGPGPNYWSDSEGNVWIDGNGWLHLKIRYASGIWYCSEVYTTEFTQYGIHRFYTIDRLDSLDRNVVFAPFLYSNDTTEVDIEFSEWGMIIPWFNAQYVVQPGYHSGNVERFWIELNGDYTTHYMNWQSDSIRFKSIHGHYEEPPNPGFLIHGWLYTGDDIPFLEENLRVHINLWLYQGNPPSNGQEVEVVIKNADLPPPLGMKQFNQREEKPTVFTLNQNYPNPVYSRTVIKYALPKKSQVELKVYDASGREIITLLNKEQSAGFYKVNWNIRAVSKMKLPNGVYFYRLKAANFIESKKMVILR
ncbi:T9SS type A sorting domain-containing protein [candidate division WOR-3 bacterium]|nr:T9SS type A sorting domain-containing protein [candidate division WOR-3 bacterium]